MEELQKIKIRMEVTNQYGDKFAIEQEVDEEYTDDCGEMSVYHNAYLSFLKTAGFMIDYDERIVLLSDDEYIETYCDEDCDNCILNDDENQPCQWK